MSEDIKKLSDYSHSRLRTEMYLGSRSLHTQEVLLYKDGVPVLEEVSWVPAVFTAFREVFDNALDEVVGHGHGNRIDVEYDEATGIVAVTDNGRGIPIDKGDDGIHKATLAMSEARAGRNFGERKEVAGTNGIGAAVVNFCSEWFKLEIVRDNKKFVQEFTEGNAVMDTLQIKTPTIREIKADRTGTKVSFKLSNEVFKDKRLPERFIRSRVFEVAVINNWIQFYYNGERIRVRPSVEKTLFEKDKVIVIETKEEGFKTKFIVKPDFHEGSDFYHSVVNNIPALNGGHHIDAFRRGFISGILTGLERESKRRKLTPNRSDVNEGLLVLNITQMNAPNFDSQSKTRLINEEAGKIVTKMLTNEDLFKDIIRKNKDWIDSIFERCAERTHKKDADDLAKAGKKLSRKKVPKLTDATSPKRADCILFLAEGDCIHENTLVLKLDGENFGTTEVKHIRVGDQLLTHENRIRSVLNISTKVTNGIQFNLRNGTSITVSPKHRMLAYSKLEQSIAWVEAEHLTLDHQLVRSKVVDVNGFWELKEITRTTDPIYPLTLKVTDTDDVDVVLQSSLTHRFAVFDMERQLFEMLPAEQLKLGTHCLIAVVYTGMEAANAV